MFVTCTQVLLFWLFSGKGLGRAEDGISEAIKVKVKCDKGGVSDVCVCPPCALCWWWCVSGSVCCSSSGWTQTRGAVHLPLVGSCFQQGLFQSAGGDWSGKIAVVFVSLTLTVYQLLIYRNPLTFTPLLRSHHQQRKKQKQTGCQVVLQSHLCHEHH